MQTKQRSISIYNLFAFLCVVAAIGYTAFELVNYSLERGRLQASVKIAGVAVGGLTADEARERIGRTLRQPVELYFRGDRLLLDPQVINFNPKLENMLALADTYRSERNYWQGYWEYIWQQPSQPVEVLIDAEYNQHKLQAFLEDVAQRYNVPPALPITNSDGSLTAGDPGYSLDIASSMAMVELALRSANNRRANLTVARGEATAPTATTVLDFVQNYLEQTGFDGALSVVYINLQTGAEVSYQPNVVYDGADTLKIPLLLSAYQNWPSSDEPPALPTEIAPLVRRTLTYAGDNSTELLLQALGNGKSSAGIDKINQLLNALGLRSTQWVNASAQLNEQDNDTTLKRTPTPTAILPPIRPNDIDAGAEVVKTPVVPSSAPLADDQTQQQEVLPDGETDPQPVPTALQQVGGAVRPALQTLQQANPREIASLLTALYQCAEYDGGVLRLLYPTQFTPATCQQMLGILAQNQYGALLQVGLPADATFQRRMTVTTNTYADAGIVRSTDGDFVLVVYAWRAAGLDWQTHAPLFADLATLVYRYHTERNHNDLP